MTEAKPKLPEIPNDPNHPLRPFIFRWIADSHINGGSWSGSIHRDDFHGIREIVRVPRRRGGTATSIPMGTFYQFDGEEEEMGYKEMIERIREKHGEYAGNVLSHPLVIAWQEDGAEIPYTPSEPAFPIGSTVRRSYAGLTDDFRKEMFDKDERRGTVEKGNALYVLVKWDHGIQWQPARSLVPA